MHPSASRGKDLDLDHRIEPSREDRGCDLERAMDGRGRARRFEQHRRHRQDRRTARRPRRADPAHHLQRAAQPCGRRLQSRMDPEPRFRRKMHARGARRDSRVAGRRSHLRRLLHSSPKLFHGALGYTRIIHEGIEMQTDRSIGKLENAIWQFPFRNFEEVLHKANRYSTIGARMLADKRVSMGTALGHAIWAFIKHYVFKFGFRDGWAGFVIAVGNFEGTFYRYAKRHEETQAWAPPPSEPLRRPVTREN